MLRAKKSDPGFEEMYFLVDTYAKLKNPHLFFDLYTQDGIELAVEREYIRMLIEEKIQVGEL
jgi:hypothetical protein